MRDRHLSYFFLHPTFPSLLPFFPPSIPSSSPTSTSPSPSRRLNLGLSLLLLLTDGEGWEEGEREGRGVLVNGKQEALRSIACAVSELEGGGEGKGGWEEMVVLQEGRDVQSTFEEEAGGEEGGRGSILFPSLQAPATRAKMAKHILGWCEAQEKREEGKRPRPPKA